MIGLFETTIKENPRWVQLVGCFSEVNHQLDFAAGESIDSIGTTITTTTQGQEEEKEEGGGVPTVTGCASGPGSPGWEGLGVPEGSGRGWAGGFNVTTTIDNGNTTREEKAGGGEGGEEKEKRVPTVAGSASVSDEGGRGGGGGGGRGGSKRAARRRVKSPCGGSASKVSMSDRPPW